MKKKIMMLGMLGMLGLSGCQNDTVTQIETNEKALELCGELINDNNLKNNQNTINLLKLLNQDNINLNTIIDNNTSEIIKKIMLNIIENKILEQTNKEIRILKISETPIKGMGATISNITLIGKDTNGKDITIELSKKDSSLLEIINNTLNSLILQIENNEICTITDINNSLELLLELKDNTEILSISDNKIFLIINNPNIKEKTKKLN